MLRDPSWNYDAFMAQVAKQDLALDRAKEERTLNLWHGDEFLGTFTKPEGREAQADIAQAMMALLQGRVTKLRLIGVTLAEKFGWIRVRPDCLTSREAALHWWVQKAPALEFIKDKVNPGSTAPVGP